MGVCGICERPHGLFQKRCFHAADKSQLRFLCAGEPFLRHRIEPQAAVGLPLIEHARVRRDEGKAALGNQHMLAFFRSVGIGANDNVEPFLLRRLRNGLQHFIPQSRAVAERVNARTEFLHRVKTADIAVLRHTAEKGANHAPAPLSLASQLTGEDPACAAAELCKIHLRVHRHAAFALHLAHRAQRAVGAAIVRAILIAQRNDLCAARLGCVQIVKARQVDISLAGGGIAWFKHMGSVT